MIMQSLTVPDSLAGVLAEAALKRGLNPQRVVEEALEDVIQDLQDVAIAEAVLASGEPRYSHQEVKRICGLDD